MQRTEPPLMQWHCLVGSEWWGSGMILLRGEPIGDNDRQEAPWLDEKVAAYLAQLPGEVAELGPIRWSTGPYAGYSERGVSGWSDAAIDTDLLTYAEAEGGVDEWRRIEAPQMVKGAPEVTLVGLCGGEPVAVLAPRKVHLDDEVQPERRAHA